MTRCARLAALSAALLVPAAAQAAGWETVHQYVKPSGRCAGHEVLASWYETGRITANGEAFDANGNTAAARTWPLGTVLTVTNPENGRSIRVRINDRGPWGIAWEKGARLDLARGAAQRLGMPASQYVCVQHVGGGTGARDAGLPAHPSDKLIHLY